MKDVATKILTPYLFREYYVRGEEKIPGNLRINHDDEWNAPDKLEVELIKDRSCPILVSDQGLFHFYMQQVPGCCGICISFHTWVETEFRGKGIGNLLMKLKLQIAKEAGYTFFMATTNQRCDSADAIFKKYNFFIMNTFINKRTLNSITVWGKQL